MILIGLGQYQIKQFVCLGGVEKPDFPNVSRITYYDEGTFNGKNLNNFHGPISYDRCQLVNPKDFNNYSYNTWSGVEGLVKALRDKTKFRVEITPDFTYEQLKEIATSLGYNWSPNLCAEFKYVFFNCYDSLDISWCNQGWAHSEIPRYDLESDSFSLVDQYRPCENWEDFEQFYLKPVLFITDTVPNIKAGDIGSCSCLVKSELMFNGQWWLDNCELITPINNSKKIGVKI